MTQEKQGSIRTPLGHARGLGSAKEGAHHWWMQRVSSIALIPLSIFWLSGIACIGTGSYADFVNWIGSPFVAVAAILFIAASFYHASLGIQVIIEDYITAEGLKITLLLLNNFTFIALGAASLFSIIYISFSLHGHYAP